MCRLMRRLLALHGRECQQADEIVRGCGIVKQGEIAKGRAKLGLAKAQMVHNLAPRSLTSPYDDSFIE
jgi:hypothetical protein